MLRVEGYGWRDDDASTGRWSTARAFLCSEKRAILCSSWSPDHDIWWLWSGDQSDQPEASDAVSRPHLLTEARSGDRAELGFSSSPGAPRGRMRGCLRWRHSNLPQLAWPT